MAKLKNLYFLLVILFSGMALAFFRSNEGLIILWSIGLLIFWKETFQSSKKLLVALGVWMGYFVINTIIIRSFHPMFMGIYIAKIMIAYWLLTLYRAQIFEKYENLIYKLTIVSLVFYAIQLIIPDSAMWNVFKNIDLSSNLFPNKFYASIGLYTFHQKELGELIPRNAGFCWEPGPFSSYVVLALFINIVRNGVKLKDKKRLLVFLLAIVTAQSTTSFVILLAVIIWFAWSSVKNKAFRIFLVPIALTFVIYIFTSVPWMQDKIISESQQDVEEVLTHAAKSGGSYAPGRFASFKLRWEDFKNYPIAGYGGNSSLQYGYLGEDNVVAAINGVGTILGRYGSIGFLLFLWLNISTGKWLSRYYHYSAHIIFPVLVLIIGFGFGIIESPVFVTLWMVPVFLSINKNFIKRSA